MKRFSMRIKPIISDPCCYSIRNRQVSCLSAVCRSRTRSRRPGINVVTKRALTGKYGQVTNVFKLQAKKVDYRRVGKLVGVSGELFG